MPPTPHTHAARLVADRANRRPPLLLEPSLDGAPSILGQVIEWIDTVEILYRRLEVDAVADDLHHAHPGLDRAVIRDVVCVDRDGRLDVLGSLRAALERELGLTGGARGWRAGL